MAASGEGEAPERLVAVSDCSRVQLRVHIQDEAVFALVAVLSPFDKAASARGDACAVLVLGKSCISYLMSSCNMSCAWYI